MDKKHGIQSKNENEPKPAFRPTWKRRLLFLLAGFLVAMALLWLTLNWLDIVRWLLDKPNMGYSFQPGWSKGVGNTLKYSGWILILLIILFRVVIGKKICPVFFSIGIVLVFYVLPFCWIAWIMCGEELVHRKTFDAEVWRNDTSGYYDDWPTRLCMADSLIESKKLDGLSYNEVINLLGQPTGKGFPFGIDSNGVHYRLGLERGFIRIDSEWLIINFDASSHVDDYYLFRD